MAGTVIRYPDKPFPIFWEQAADIDTCAHQWESVYVETRPRHFEEIDRCKTCHCPRCDRLDRGSADPGATRCIERRHHREVHIFESGEFEPVGGALPREGP